MRPSIVLRLGLVAVPCACVFAAGGCGLVLDLGSFKNDCGEPVDAPCDGGALCQPGQQQACYTGDPSTKGKGICKSGMQTCGSDGLFGDCMGEVLPKDKDICGNGLDDDCNGKVDDGCPCTPGKKVACYDGPTGTEDVGDCKHGLALCEPDGMTLGVCIGEVKPTTENFDKPGDENCDGIPSADTEWVTLVTSDTSFDVTALAADGEGSVYLGGVFSGKLTIGSKSTPTAPTTDAFLAKLDTDGKTIWIEDLGALSIGSGGLAFDTKTNHLLVAGTTLGVDLGGPGGPLPAGLVVAAYDPSGKIVWSNGCAGPASAVAGVVVDSQGRVTAGGLASSGTLTCGTHTATFNPGGFFTAQLDNSGAPNWIEGFNDTMSDGGDSMNALAVGSDGSIWWTATLTGQFIVPGNTMIGKPSGNIVIVRQNAGGVVKAAEAFGQGGQYAYGLAVDQSANLVLIGTNRGTVNFGQGDLSPTELAQVVVASFDATGVPLWSAAYEGQGVNNADDGRVVLIEPTGVILLAGGAATSIDIGGGLFEGDTADYGFLGEYRPKPAPSPPALQWAKYYGGKKTANNASVDVRLGALAKRTGSSELDVVLSGPAFRAADFGTGTIGPTSGNYNFVMKVAP